MTSVQLLYNNYVHNIDEIIRQWDSVFVQFDYYQIDCYKEIMYVLLAETSFFIIISVIICSYIKNDGLLNHLY